MGKMQCHVIIDYDKLKVYSKDYRITIKNRRGIANKPIIKIKQMLNIVRRNQ